MIVVGRMETTTPFPPPKRRWFRRRKLLFALLLAAGGVIAFFAWDALFMPADLRRMQGTWKVAKILTADGKLINFGKDMPVAFHGRHLSLNDDDRFPIELRDGEFFLYDNSNDDERTILGFKVRVPVWLRRADRMIFGTYEFSDGQLMFWVKGGKNLIDNSVDGREEQQMRIFLERN